MMLWNKSFYLINRTSVRPIKPAFQFYLIGPGSEGTYYHLIPIARITFKNLARISKTNSNNSQQLTSHLF